MTEPIAHAVAVRIARAHGCVRCGVCGAETDLGIDAEGDVLYAS